MAGVEVEDDGVGGGVRPRLGGQDADGADHPRFGSG
jgi:hypothetical protein